MKFHYFRAHVKSNMYNLFCYIYMPQFDVLWTGYRLQKIQFTFRFGSYSHSIIEINAAHWRYINIYAQISKTVSENSYLLRCLSNKTCQTSSHLKVWNYFYFSIYRAHFTVEPVRQKIGRPIPFSSIAPD